MGNSIKGNILAFRESEDNIKLSLGERNKRLLLEKFERKVTEDGQRILVLDDSISNIRGQVAIYVKSDGTVRKAVLDDNTVMKKLNIESTEYIMAEGEKFFLYEELGAVANSTGYRAVKIPYSEAYWQPYKHVLVAVAFGLTDGKAYFDDWVINHLAGKEQGDNLDNIEVVTQGENTAAGKEISSLIDEYPYIKFIKVSAKQGHALKYFHDSICGSIEELSYVNRAATQGYKYIFDNIKYVVTPDEIKITGNLKYSYTGIDGKNHRYNQPILIVLDKFFYELSQVEAEVEFI